MKTSLVFLAAKRTPFGANGGLFRDVPAVELGLLAANAAIAQSRVAPSDFDHVIFGSVLYSSGDSIYIPRHVGLRAGIPEAVPALGINRLCGTGFQTVVEAYQQMCAGDTKIALVGGVENMSQAPFLIRSVRWGAKMGHQPITDIMMESLYDVYAGAPMAITAENLAEKYRISREDSDRFALRSQTRYEQGFLAGEYASEIVPYETQDRKGNAVRLDRDEHSKPATTLEGLGKLKPLFKKDGVVTAGNASGIVDGAAVLVVATEEEAKIRGLTPLGRLVSYGVSGCDPKIMGIGPAPASRQALARAGLKISDMDLIEVNEAFAPQALAVQKELEIPDDVFNVDGGAVALGHPLAASGTRIVAHLLYGLRRRKKRFGLGAACIGGGQGIALVVEAYS